MSRKLVRGIGLSALITLAGLVESAAAATLTVPVRAEILGLGSIEKIGQIVADDRFRGLADATAEASGLTATFTFDNRFSDLDNYYDFDWVSVVEEELGTANFFPDPLPTIDPKPAHNPDDHPYYYSVAEWNNNTFAGQTIHVDGVSSTFGDVPNQDAGTVFSFSTYLVARGNGSYELDGAKAFCVLGGFTWTYAGALGDTDHNRGTSTVGDPIVAPLDPRLIDRINTAIDNAAAAANSDVYRSWHGAAMGNCALVPEPTTLALLGLGIVASLLHRRRYRCRLR